MKKHLIAIIPLVLLACTKSRQDTTFTYVCTSTNGSGSPFTPAVKDTTLYNITTAFANAYARNTSVNGWYTTCEKQ